jgi:hypothetical protein
MSANNETFQQNNTIQVEPYSQVLCEFIIHGVILNFVGLVSTLIMLIDLYFSKISCVLVKY